MQTLRGAAGHFRGFCIFLTKNYYKSLILNGTIGGRGEIRTHGGLAPTTVFKTVALNRSATLPSVLLVP